MAYTCIDLFSGAGGTGYGFSKAGFEILGAIENNKNAALTYEKNLNVNVTMDDLASLSPHEFRITLGVTKEEVDVIVGCPPCQGFSRMRVGAGEHDARNELVHSYLRFVAEFLPKFALFENVPGIVRYRYGQRHYRSLCVGLEGLGYHLSELNENAVNFGTPQNRRRIIVVGSLLKKIDLRLTRTHADPNSNDPNDGECPRWRTVRDAIAGFPALKAGENGENEGRFPNHVAPTIRLPRVMEFIKKVPVDGGRRVDVPKKLWLPCHLNSNPGHFDTYSRLAWDKPANTLTCGCTNVSKGRYVHPEQNRGLSYREAAALQGFDESFVFYGKEIAKQIGNAVPPQLAEALAVAIKAQL